MSTTTIRLDDDLKARIASAAERAGKTAHAFMLDAVTETVARDEAEAEFHRLADERWAHLLESGESVAWSETKSWLEARARGRCQHQRLAVLRTWRRGSGLRAQRVGPGRASAGLPPGPGKRRSGVGR